MDCSCVNVDINDAPDLYIKKYVKKARKGHLCCECHQSIPKGSGYEIVVGTWVGIFDSFKTCLDCVSVRQMFFCDGYNHKGLWEEFEEHIFECYNELNYSLLSYLTKTAKDRVCDMIERCWEQWEDDDENEN